MTTVVIGAGQAGLAVSRELGQVGVEHVVLERDRVAQAWRGRWDSFSLVTPNWTLDLPGSPYAGDDPEGHVVRDEIVAYLEAYAATHAAGEIREGVAVDRLSPGAAGDPAPRHVRRTHRRRRRRGLHRRLPTAAPPRRRRRAPAGPHAARRHGVPEPGRPPRRASPGRRVRPDRHPARGGAAPRRAGRGAVLRPRAVGATPPRWDRHRHLAGPGRVLRAAQDFASRSAGPARREPPGHGNPRRPRPALPRPPAAGRPPGRAAPGRRRTPSDLRGRPRGLGCLRRRALRRRTPAAAGPARRRGSTAAGPRAVRVRPGDRGRPARLRCRRPHLGLPPRLHGLGGPAGLRRARLPGGRRRPRPPTCRASSSAACTSCAPAGRRCCSASGTTRRSWPPRCPGRPARPPGTADAASAAGPGCRRSRPRRCRTASRAPAPRTGPRPARGCRRAASGRPGTS